MIFKKKIWGFWYDLGLYELFRIFNVSIWKICKINILLEIYIKNKIVWNDLND